MSRRRNRARTSPAALIDDLAERRPWVQTFVRGLTLGALVGAAVAGSTIWQRRRGRGADWVRRPREVGRISNVGRVSD